MPTEADSRFVIVGGGLAGSEAAWQAAEAGACVVLHEMRPVRMTEAHQTHGLAELVCSNSFRPDAWDNNAAGLLHDRRLGAGGGFEGRRVAAETSQIGSACMYGDGFEGGFAVHVNGSVVSAGKVERS